VDRVEPGEFLAGRTDGRLTLVGRNVAPTDLALLHEVAHPVVGLEHGHGEPWRSVDVAAVRERFGDRSGERELRRSHWVYDTSYPDDSHVP
jgi:hypothetical protein